MSVRYANQNATRSLPLSPQLLRALSFLPELGVTMEVFSGGQHERGEGPRVGSTRHDHGNAADVFFYKDGRKLDWASETDRPIFEEIVRRGKAAGITGFGAGEGYMRPGSMHIGFGAPAVWGAGGRGANAPDWLRAAYSGAVPGAMAPSSIAAAQPAAPPQAPGTTAPPMGPGQNIASIPEPQPIKSPVNIPAPVLAAAQNSPSPVANMASIFGSMAPNPPTPQHAPAQFQGPSPQQANALSSFIAALKQQVPFYV